TRHPQLERFRDAPDPLALVGAYLAGVAEEAARRGYRFDRERIRIPAAPAGQLTVTEGQLALEWRHLLDKLATRSPDDAARQRDIAPRAHPLFRVVPGPVAPWERADGRARRRQADRPAPASTMPRPRKAHAAITTRAGTRT